MVIFDALLHELMENGEISFGSEIIEINETPISTVILNRHEYYTTDIKTGYFNSHFDHQHILSMSNETTEEHKTYITFLDSVLKKIKAENSKNLIIHVR